jgi:hypothetical protein
MLLMAFNPVQAAPGDVYPIHFSYSCTNNNPADVAGSLGQFSVDISDMTDAGGPKASFTFYNTGPYQSSITQVYFQDGVLFDIAQVINGTGTLYTQGGSPPNLPGGNGCIPPFRVTAGFLATPDSPTMWNGVNNIGEGEYVTILFNLYTGTSFADLIAGLESGAVRIGIHVQGYGSGGSESFVTGAGTAIKLDSFSASDSRGVVSLSWTTGTEIDNAGFNLYRSSSPEGQRVKVNSGLISAAAGSASGASYSAVDAPGYGTYFYWLEDVSTGGAATLHGPVNVTLAPAFRLPTYRPVLPGGS